MLFACQVVLLSDEGEPGKSQAVSLQSFFIKHGELAAFCGMFYEPTHRYAYVEPVATDPAYRRMGLGKAAVLEGIRRCAELGAQTAYVGSVLEFYLALGFKKIYTSECWVKYLD